MEFDATVIQERGLTSIKIRFNPTFSTFENACTKSGIWQLLSIRLMCFIIWLWTFRFAFSSEFSILVILPFNSVKWWILNSIERNQSDSNFALNTFSWIKVHWKRYGPWDVLRVGLEVHKKWHGHKLSLCNATFFSGS